MDVFTDTATPRFLKESLKMTQRARFLEKFKAAKVLNNLDAWSLILVNL